MVRIDTVHDHERSDMMNRGLPRVFFPSGWGVLGTLYPFASVGSQCPGDRAHTSLPPPGRSAGDISHSQIWPSI